VTELVGVFVGVTEFVGVTDGVTDGVGVILEVGVGVILEVTDGVGEFAGGNTPSSDTDSTEVNGAA